MSTDAQNKRYRDAVGQRNVGSQPSGAIKKNAQATALGKNIRRATTTNSVASSQSKARGSMEGYMHGASTYIQMNGSGYSAKSQHKARGPRTPKNLSNRNFDNPVSRLNSIASNVYDYSYRGQPKSSKQRLAKITKLNNMF